MPAEPVAVVEAPSPPAVAVDEVDLKRITVGVVEQIRTDPRLAERIAEGLRGKDAFFAVPSRELIDGDETFEVEFNSTARWNLREGAKDHLAAALTHTAVMRTRTRIEHIDDVEICRIDVARSSRPVTARTSDRDEKFWVRMNNSTRALPEIEIEDYRRDHW